VRMYVAGSNSSILKELTSESGGLFLDDPHNRNANISGMV